MTPWAVARQAPLSTGFSRQEDWSGLPCPPPGELPDSGIEPWSPALQEDSLLSEPPGKPNKSICILNKDKKTGPNREVLVIERNARTSKPNTFIKLRPSLIDSFHP